jgi:hypothetical protein
MKSGRNVSPRFLCTLLLRPPPLTNRPLQMQVLHRCRVEPSFERIDSRRHVNFESAERVRTIRCSTANPGRSGLDSPMKPRLSLLLLGVLMIGVALVASAWRSALHDSQKLAATLTAQNAAIQQAGERQKQRDAELAALLASIQSERRAVHTPQQAASQLPEVLPPLPLPVTIQVPSLSAPHPSDEPSETTLSIPAPDLIPLYNSLQDCRAAEAQASASQQNLSDEKARSAALLRERDGAIATARGGSMLSRIKRAAKWFAIGIAVGAASTRALKR